VNLRHTVELAALVSKQSDQVIETPQQLPESAIQDFWVHSQRRLFDWMRQLVRYPVEIESSSAVGRRRIWRRTESLLVDFFVSDVLARVWAAVLTAADQRQCQQRTEPLARHILAGYLQTRYLALNLMVSGPDVPPDRLREVNRIRRKTECWTDLLLGPLVVRYEVKNFAVNADRALQFGQDQLSHRDSDVSNTAWNLILLSARLTFPARQPLSPIHSICQRKISDAVLSTFPADAIHDFSLLKSIRQTGLSFHAAHSEGTPAVWPIPFGRWHCN